MIMVEMINFARVYLILVLLNINQNHVGSSPAVELQAVREKKPNNLSNRSCHIPALSLDKIITYNNCGKTESLSCGTTDGVAPRDTKATIKCKPNYHFESKASASSTCTRNGWEPPIVDCYKKCEKLNPINVDLECFRGDKNITCDENSLLAGVKVHPKCKALHFYDEFVPSFLEMTCDQNGKWDKILFSCVPECGKPNKNFAATGQGRNKSSFSDSPWHVAIYNANKDLICGGTLISTNLVLSAAQCFQEEGIPSENANNYEVVVGKVSKNYTTKDNDYQKTYKIKEIRFSPKGYFGQKNYFAADIAALVLNEKLIPNQVVMPACVDWSDTYIGQQSLHNKPGKATGWRLNERPSFGEKSTTLDLSFISRMSCLDLVPSDFIPYITFDKFCATTKDGPALSQGFGGSGLLFQKDSSYYVRGIASVTPVASSNVTTFTDLADHMPWISELRKELENGNTSTTPPKKLTPALSGEDICISNYLNNCVKIQDCQIAQHLIETEQSTFCGHDRDNKERICCTDLLPPVINNNITQEQNKESLPSRPSNTNAKPQSEDPLPVQQPSIVNTTPQNKNPGQGHSAVTNTKPQNKDPSLDQPSFTNIPVIYTTSLNEDPSQGNPSITNTKPQNKDPSISQPSFTNTRNQYTFFYTKWLINRDTPQINPFITNTDPQIKDPSQGYHSSSNTDSQDKNPWLEYTFIDKTKPPNEDPSQRHPLYINTLLHDTAIFQDKPFISNTNPLHKNPWQGDHFFSNTHLQDMDLWLKNWFIDKTKPQNKDPSSQHQPFLINTPSQNMDMFQDNPFISHKNPLNKNPLQGLPSVVTTTNPLIKTTNTKNSTEIALSYCEKYSQFATDFIYQESPAGQKEPAQLKEFPHIAFIVILDRGGSIQKWTCVGSLISEQFILSSTSCEKILSDGDTLWALLGHLSIDVTKADINDLHYIETSYIHPDYLNNQIANDIALYKLQTRVKITPYIRPACLYTFNSNQLHNKLQAASWETSAINKPRPNAELMKASITVVDDSKCSTRANDLQHSYNPNAMVCVGNISDGDTLSMTAAGSPLLISIGDNNCIWSIFATSTRRNYDKECVYLKVSHYLDWIQSIVWPNG